MPEAGDEEVTESKRQGVIPRKKQRRGDVNEAASSELPCEIWVDYVVPYFERPAWNSFRMVRNEYNKIMTTRSLPPWPRSFLMDDTGSDRQLSAFSLSSNSEWIAYSILDGRIAFYHCLSGKKYTSGSVHAEGFKTLMFSPKDPTFLVSKTDSEVVVWDLSKTPPSHNVLGSQYGSAAQQHPIPRWAYIHDYDISPDGKLVVFSYTSTAFGFPEERITIWRLEDGAFLRQWRIVRSDHMCYRVGFLSGHNNERYRVASYDQSGNHLILVWEFDSEPVRDQRGEIQTSPSATPPQTELVLEDVGICQEVIVDRGTRRFQGVGGNDLKNIKLWQTDGKLVHSWTAPVTIRQQVRLLDLSSPKETLLCFQQNDIYGIWSLDRGTCVATIQKPGDGEISQVAITPSGRDMVSLSTTGDISFHRLPQSTFQG